MPEQKAEIDLAPPRSRSIWPWHVALLSAVFIAWYALTRGARTKRPSPGGTPGTSA